MTSPPKKRRKAEAAAAASASSATSLPQPPPPSSGAIKAEVTGSTTAAASAAAASSASTATTSTITALLNTLDDIETSVTSPTLSDLLTAASSQFLHLKQAQRSLCLAVESELVGRVDSAREGVEAESLKLQNLVYERDYLRGQVRECRDLECAELVRMARDELGLDEENDGKKEEADDKEEVEGGDDAAVDRFLSRSVDSSDQAASTTATKFDHRDPQNHPQTISLLKNELNLRRTTESDLQKAKMELAELKKRTAARRTFLDGLPRKLKEIERSTGPVQAFFREHVKKQQVQEASRADGDRKSKAESGKKKGDMMISPTTLLGTARNDRIDASLSLPAPLYTLYVQLQGYLDAFANTAGDDNVASLKLDIIEDKRPSAAAAAAGGGGGAAMRFVEGLSQEEGGRQLRRSSEDWVAAPTTADDGGNAGRVVVLTVPVPDVSVDSPHQPSSSSSSSGSLVVEFRFLPRLSVVTASATASSSSAGAALGGGGGDASSANAGSGPDVLAARVLANLFPDDDGTVLPGCAAPFLVGEGAKTEEKNEDVISEIESLLVSRGDRPYQWCQYVAGLQFPSPPPPSSPPATEKGSGGEKASRPRSRVRIEPSTSAVVRSLLRRVRAQATLSALLRTLERRKPNPVPVHPALLAASASSAEKNKADSSAVVAALPTATSRLVGWTETSAPSSSGGGAPADTGGGGASGGGAAPRYYLATIKHPKTGNTLRATVRIDPSYPAVPPLWSLQPCTASALDEDDGDSRSWGERHGSAETLQGSTAPLYDPALGRIEDSVNGSDLANLVVDGVEGTYDWILVHQLRVVVAGWDEVQQSSSGGGDGGASAASSSAGGGGGGGFAQRRGRDRRHVGFDMYCRGL